MHNLVILTVEMTYGAQQDWIHPVVLCDEANRVLVDCGYVRSLPRIEAALRENGLEPDTITHLLLTHQDHDHVGAAAAFRQKYPQVQVLASALEAPYISGARKSLRLEQAEQLQQSLPPEQQAFGKAFCDLLRSVEPVKVDWLLEDRAQLPFCGGCQVIATPGHTPGHLSLYLPQCGAVITGDAVALENGRPVLANPQFTLDLQEAQASLQKLFTYPAQRLVCYHGGVLNLPQTANPELVG